MSHVITCIDGSDVSTAACDYGAWASLRLDAPLEFLHVLEKTEYPEQSNLSGNIGLGSREALLEELAALDEKRGRLALEQGKLMLEAARERAIADGVAAPTSRQRHGSLVETLAEMEDDIRLLVMGKHDENLGEHVGSRLESVVRMLHRPILITTPEFTPPQRVMLAFDGSDTTRKGVEMVAGSPLFRGLPCHLVMIGSDNAANHEQLDWARRTLEAAGFEAPVALHSGEVERVLCDYRSANNIDLLVMGAYGHSVIRRFLVGSTTTNVMRNASVPVLLLR
ncbi:universal stress protein [Thiohalobacter sp. COW1]|uniref:Universal stress protein n=1 Tax=Thiohalobacter thiocyanaticus TaxID=585455 RepID=A0A1Z4VTW1_9GAMM|nr:MULTISPECIES: universal stress protein [Thiohalobacter]BAZ94832.1 universal stress protein [Thiohalobacter thiocyanaticus]BCO33245.1 universal stress protein [Thiohalobacter sp. COW1]